MRQRIFSILLIGASWSTVSSAQTGSEPPSPSSQNFAEAKAQHIARLEQALACVQAATSFETMRACMPPPQGGHMGPPPSQQPKQ
jgi:hypothetical protein